MLGSNDDKRKNDFIECEAVRVKKIIFTNKQRIPWKEVERYMRQYEGKTFIIERYGDAVKLNHVSANEYTTSEYSKRLKGALSKIKANLVQEIPELIEKAANRRWTENKHIKHNKNAKNGWYRYDVRFTIPVKNPESMEVKWKSYTGTLVVRANDEGLFFYDIINIKKETSTPGEL